MIKLNNTLKLRIRFYLVTVSLYPGGGVSEVCQHINNGMNKKVHPNKTYRNVSHFLKVCSFNPKSTELFGPNKVLMGGGGGCFPSPSVKFDPYVLLS